MLKGYYVNLEGMIIVISEVDGKYLTEFGEVLLRSVGTVELNTVYEGAWEPEEGFRVDEEYVLWTDLSKLQEAIEEQ